MKFRKKPVVIEARQLTPETIDDVAQWCGSKVWGWALPKHQQHLVIETLEGDHNASMGDWIIQGVKGEFYPCKPDIFEMTYEVAE
jgi:hypothetical protein